MEINLPLEGFARPKQVANALGVSRSMIYKMVNEKKFPAPLKDGRLTLWPVEQVRAAISQRRDALALVGQDNQPSIAS